MGKGRSFQDRRPSASDVRTGASAGPPNLGADALYARAETPDDIAAIRDKSVIFWIELFAAVATISSPRHSIRSRSVAVCMANNAALSALIKGGSSSIIAARLISFGRYIAATSDITLRFETVSPDQDIADLPSRGEIHPLDTQESYRFELP